MPKKSPRDKLDGIVTVEVYQREDIMGCVPWIALLPSGIQKRCNGITSGAPLYMFWKMSEREDTDPKYAEEMENKRIAARERHSCKKNARWVFVSEDGAIHSFCTDHLYTQGISRNMEEELRFKSWIEKFYQSSTEE